MIRDDLRALLGAAISRAQASGALPAVAVPEIQIERTARPEFGDYTSNVALKMKRSAGGLNPMAIASAIATHAELPESVSALEVAPPGFINVHLSYAWLQQQVDAVLAAGPRFGEVPLGQGGTVQVEFVSANPTGPLHIGAGRGAALGDTLARVLAAAGYAVQREYYINDLGSRMEAFQASVYARYAQVLGEDVPLPEDGYPGEYLVDIARQIVAEEGRRYLDLPRAEALPRVGRRAMELVLAGIRSDLERIGVTYDRWFSETSLYEEGLVDQVLALLVAQREGAIWFTSTELGEDKDNVLVRSNGAPTYFASDVAYHYDKFVRRGFDRVIDVWGADHQGHVPRMKAVLAALGIDPDRLVVVLNQLVNLVREGKPVRMGKRTGMFVTLREVIDEVGPDAIRFFLLARSADAMMEFDLDLAKRASAENPVYYVQYAHARIASILRRAQGIDFRDGDVRLLAHPSELALIRKMLQLPEVVASAAEALAPHTLPFYAQELATVFHAFYRDCRVVSDDLPLTKARLKLVAACKLALANTLTLMGVSAPEEMERLPAEENH